MAKVEYVSNPLDPPEKFAGKLIDVPKALKEVAGFLLTEAQGAFRTGGWRGGVKWPPRRVPNVAGIIRDLQEGGEPKKRRFEEGQTNVDTGRLRGNFDVRIDEAKATVTLANFSPYASAVHEGGARGPFPGAKDPGPIRAGLAAFLRKSPEWKKDLGWLFGMRTWSYKKVPARPLVPTGGLPPALARDVRKIVLSHVVKTGG